MQGHSRPEQPPAVQVDHGRQIQLSGVGGNLRHVTDPCAVRRIGGEVPFDQVNETTTVARLANWAYYRQVADHVELGCSTSSQVGDPLSALIAPLGATEQHGPHLPLDTDTRIASAVARATADAIGAGYSCADQPWNWLVAPALAYGASGEHQSFAGTVSVGTEALTLMLVEYGRSASCWATRVVFVNGHGGNVAALKLATKTLRSEGRDVGWCSCSAAGSDAHAGHTETSVLLHLSPEDVLTECWHPGNCAPLADLLPSIRCGGVAAVSPIGVLGNPTTATAADGERIFAEMVHECVRRIIRWAPRHDGMLA